MQVPRASAAVRLPSAPLPRTAPARVRAHIGMVLRGGGAARFGIPRLMTSSGEPYGVGPDGAPVDALVPDPPSTLITISGTPVAPFVFEVVPVVDGWPAGEGAPTATPEDVLKLM